MDLADQGEVDGFSPAYISPPSNVSDTKVHEEHSASQSSFPGVNEKTRFTLVDRTKSEDNPPDYSGRPKAGKDVKPLVVRSRGAVSHAKISTNIPKKTLAVKQRPIESPCQIFSHPLLSKPCEPTAEKNHEFSARIKLDDRLQDELEAGIYDPSRTYLTQPIAIGDWYGCECAVLALKGQPKQYFGLPNKATWGEFLHDLYICYPSGTWRDFKPGDEDLDTDDDSEYFDIEVLLLTGAPVV